MRRRFAFKSNAYSGSIAAVQSRLLTPSMSATLYKFSHPFILGRSASIDKTVGIAPATDMFDRLQVGVLA
jgi:hypothetical protein